jgi:hypothetical protein
MVKYTDLDRKWVYNNTDKAVVVRTEDGVITPELNGYKVSDTKHLNPTVNVEITQDDDGTYHYKIPNREGRIVNGFLDFIKKKFSRDGENDLSGPIPRERHHANYWFEQVIRTDQGIGPVETWKDQSNKILTEPEQHPEITDRPIIKETPRASESDR